jgi:predicted RNA-binding protein Jag
MNPEDQRIETGKTVDEAVSRAVRALGCCRDDVRVEVLDKGGKPRFLGLARTPVTVRVSRTSELTKIKAMVEKLISLMGIEGQVFEVKEGSRNLVKIYTAGYDGLLIGRGGRTLNALQYIVFRMARKAGIKLSFQIQIGDHKRV